eukprot:859847-Alexandrium_andersonii.AAC.1
MRCLCPVGLSAPLAHRPRRAASRGGEQQAGRYPGGLRRAGQRRAGPTGPRVGRPERQFGRWFVAGRPVRQGL